MSDLLAIVMICHNDVGHLKRSIGTVLEQLQEGVRLLFVDDCSEDGSLEVAESLVGDKAEVVKTPRNMNIGGARNFGCLHLKESANPPKYVWFHDSDDYLPEGSIKRVVEALGENDGVDMLSIPFCSLKKVNGRVGVRINAVKAKSIEEVALGPVSAVCKIIRLDKFLNFAPDQYCEHVAWHYLMCDKIETWAKIEGEDPCYVWDRTNTNAISETVDYLRDNPTTFEALVENDTLTQKGLNDKWISGYLKNLALMYDVRHLLTKNYVRRAWLARFEMEYANFMRGRYIH